jgi:NAD(P)H dehydrogenase (quinone)
MRHCQTPETLPDDVLAKMHAASKPAYPIINADTMKEYGGFLFRLSGRYLTFPAQMKSFLDSEPGTGSF